MRGFAAAMAADGRLARMEGGTSVAGSLLFPGLVGALFLAASCVALFVLTNQPWWGRLLVPLYEQTASLWRSSEGTHQMLWLMTLGQLLFGLVFAWIYARGYEPGKPGLGQGLRFGLPSASRRM